MEIFLRVTVIWSDYSGVNSDRHWTKESAKKTKKGRVGIREECKER
jgi:hypothetical protein